MVVVFLAGILVDNDADDMVCEHNGMRPRWWTHLCFDLFEADGIEGSVQDGVVEGHKACSLGGYCVKEIHG